MKRISALLIGLLLAGVVHAEGFSYTRPTQRQDGTALNAADITGYEFDCLAAGTTAGVSCATVALPGSALGGTVVITFPATGGTACLRGRTSDAVGFGPWSAAPGCKTKAPPAPPNAPGNIIVVYVIDITAEDAVAALKQAGGTVYLVGNYPPQ